MIEQTLNQEDNTLSLSWLCRQTGVSRSGFHHWLKVTKPNILAREAQDRSDFAEILKAFHYRDYEKGSRMIFMHLLHRKKVMNRKKILRLMRKFGLKCRKRRPRKARHNAVMVRERAVKADYVQREFRAKGPRKILLTDITYCRYGHGQRAYLSTIKDAFTNEILAFQLSESLELSFVIQTVNQLIEKEGIHLSDETIIHSDQGVHYTSIMFQELIEDSDLIQSMSRKGNCWDNAPQESFFGHMKDEVPLWLCQTFKDVETVITDYMDYYNNERYQWGLAKLSPSQYYQFVQTGDYPLSEYYVTPEIPQVRTREVNESMLENSYNSTP